MADTHSPIRLSRSQARRLALQAQGLWTEAAPFGQGLDGTLRALEQLGYVQIDTISVVQRAHHHVLWSRVPDYQPELLDELLARKQAFEYWSHAAAYLPMRDYRFSLVRKAALQAGEKHWFEQRPELMDTVLARIREEGPLRARDFEAGPDHQHQHWFAWKPAKRALYRLYMEGVLMVPERQGFQKVYELTERVLPPEVDARVPSEAEMAEHLIEGCLRAHGLATVKQMGYQRRKEVKRGIPRVVKNWLRGGKLAELGVEGLTDPYFCFPNALEALPEAHPPGSLRLLSPFDNAVIQRERLRQLFDVDYQIECYTPAAKRQYGYFSLPMLWGAQFVGRLDAKADRKQQRLWINGLWLEPGVSPSEQLVHALAAELDRLTVFSQCTSWSVRSAMPAELMAALEAMG